MSMGLSAVLMFIIAMIMAAGVIGFFIFLMLMAFFKGDKQTKKGKAVA